MVRIDRNEVGQDRGVLSELCWLGGRDSNPDSQIQSLESYHWTTSQQGIPNLRIDAPLVNHAPGPLVSKEN